MDCFSKPRVSRAHRPSALAALTAGRRDSHAPSDSHRVEAATTAGGAPCPQAALKGETDPGPPARVEANRGRTYKTKEETASKKGVSAPVVATLLFIAVVVPMLQYWGYTSED